MYRNQSVRQLLNSIYFTGKSERLDLAEEDEPASEEKMVENVSKDVPKETAEEDKDSEENEGMKQDDVKENEEDEAAAEADGENEDAEVVEGQDEKGT